MIWLWSLCRKLVLDEQRRMRKNGVMAEATPKKSQIERWKRLESVQDADSLRQDSINAKHEHLLTEIETSDGPLATTLR